MNYIWNNLFRTRNCSVTTGGEQCFGPALEAEQCNTNVTCPGK